MECMHSRRTATAQTKVPRGLTLSSRAIGEPLGPELCIHSGSASAFKVTGTRGPSAGSSVLRVSMKVRDVACWLGVREARKQGWGRRAPNGHKARGRVWKHNRQEWVDKSCMWLQQHCICLMHSQRNSSTYDSIAYASCAHKGIAPHTTKLHMPHCEVCRLKPLFGLAWRLKTVPAGPAGNCDLLRRQQESIESNLACLSRCLARNGCQ
eukprot:scaffold174378_cov16-Tisochrysis_lutea.AAC.1